MVKRDGGVKLAHIVTAVFTLGRPRGATRSEILKFCVRNFGTRCTRRDFDRILERAEDEGLLYRYQRRYLLAKSATGNGIIWTPGKKGNKGKARRNCPCGEKESVLGSKKLRKQRTDNHLRRIKEPSFFTLWRKERRRQQVVRTRKNKKNKSRLVSSKPSRAMKRVKASKPCACQLYKSTRTTRRKSSSQRKKREEDVIERKVRKNKMTLRSRRMHHKEKHKRRKRPFHSKSCILRQNERRRSRTERATMSCRKTAHSKKNHVNKVFSGRKAYAVVTHAESWDRINQMRLRSERENQKLMKDSRLVQKILTGKHGRSWDDLNRELYRIKSCRSVTMEANLENVRRADRVGHGRRGES